jgi:hypothetical protein
MERNLDKNHPTMLHLLTKDEAAILDAAEHVKYGQLVDVEISSDAPTVSKQVTAAQIAFLMVLRDEGLSKLDQVIVHNGIPSQIEVDGQFKTIKYRRKIRFSN